ncbi:hypothetical protein MKX03_006367 [Papaver bracteatum]|nr:hypothetical protein MKX03_006367 [Papaver bracteatum]
MDSSQDDLRRSTRFIELQDRQKQLWRAQYKSKQEKMTEQQKQAFNERRRLANQNQKTRMDEASTSLFKCLTQMEDSFLAEAQDLWDAETQPKQVIKQVFKCLTQLEDSLLVEAQDLLDAGTQKNRWIKFGDETCPMNSWPVNERGSVFDKEPVV